MSLLCLEFLHKYSAISCSFRFKEVDLGFPDTVTFPSESGVEAVTGKTAYTHAEIHDYESGENGEVQKTEDGTRYNVHRWLKSNAEKSRDAAIMKSVLIRRDDD